MDIIPGLGNVVGVILSFYIIWVGLKLAVPPDKIRLMIRNVIIDFILGIFPLIGLIMDLFYKSNELNLKIIEYDLADD